MLRTPEHPLKLIQATSKPFVVQDWAISVENVDLPNIGLVAIVNFSKISPILHSVAIVEFSEKMLPETVLPKPNPSERLLPRIAITAAIFPMQSMSLIWNMNKIDYIDCVA